MKTPLALSTALRAEENRKFRFLNLSPPATALKGIQHPKSRIQNSKSSLPALILFLALLALLISNSPVRAATQTWSGTTSGNLTGNATNWGAGAVPTGADLAYFNLGSYSPVPTANGAMSFGGLWFGSASGAVTFGAGASTLTLVGPVGIQVDSGSGAVSTGSAKFALGASQTWLNNSGSLLTVGGTITNSGNATAYTLTADGTGDATLSNIISNGGTVGTTALAKNGTGTLTLSGANTYTGGITLNAGKLILGSNTALGGAASTLAIGAGTTIDVNAARTTTNNNAQTWNGDWTYGGTNTWNTGTGAVTLNVASINLTNSGGSLLTVGGTATGASNLTLKANAAGGITFTNLNNTGTITNSGSGAGTATLTTVGTLVTGLTQNSTTSALTATTLNVASGGTTLTNALGTKALTVTTAQGTGNLTLNNNSAMAAGVTVTNANIVGAITNSGDNSAGTTTIGTVAGTVTGITQNSAGNLTITTLSAPFSTTLTNTGAGLLAVTTQLTGTGSISAANYAINSTGGITLTGGGNFTGSINNNNAGTGTLTIGAIGTLVTGVTQNSTTSTLLLNGTNLYTGGTTITAGTVKLGSATALGASASAVSVAGGAVLDLNGSTMTNTNALSLNGAGLGAGGLINSSNSSATYAGAITLAGDSTIGSTGTGNTMTISGAVGGAANLTVNAAGTQAITFSTGGVNNTGNITNSGGGTGTVTLGGTIGTNVTSVIQNSSTSTLVLSGTNTAWSGSGGGIQINSGTLQIGSNTGTGTAAITLGNATTGGDAMFLWQFANGSPANAITVAGGTGNRTLRLAGAATLTSNITLNHDLIVDSGAGGGGFLMTGMISGSSNITFTNSSGISTAATQLYGTQNMFNGTLVVSNNATLQLGSGTTLSTTATLNVNSGGNANFKENTSVGGLDGASGANIYTNGNSGKVLTLIGNGTYDYAGVIRDGSVVSSLAMSGTGGIQTLSGNNTYTGTTTVSAGTLRAGVSGTAFGVNSAVTLNNTAGATLDLNNFSASIGSLAGGGTTGGNVTLGSGTLTTGGLNTVASYAGVISGTGGLIKVGTGTQTLTGNSTYNGGTTVSGGTLILNRTTGSLASGSALTFNNIGGTFTLDNTAAGGPLSQSLGTLTFSAGDGTVKTNRTVAQNTAITFSSLAARTAGTAGTFVIAGTASAANGIVLTAQATNAFIDKGIFYGTGTGTASNYAWYDSGGFVRGINYGVDAGTATSGANATLASTTNQQITGAISAQNTAAFTTFQISGINNLTLNSGATVTVDSILKQGNAVGEATISGGTGIQASNNAEMVVRTDMANDALTISSNILANGSNAFTKSGLGTLTLSGTNAYTGTTTVLGGLLSLGNGSATGTLSPTGAIFLNNGSLVINHSNQMAQGTDFSSAAITGSGSIFQIGTGTLTLNAANTYTGNTTIGASGGANVGTLSVSGSGKIGSAAVAVYAGALDLTDTTQAITNLNLGGGSAASTASVVIASGGILNLGGSASVTYLATNNPNGATISGSGTLNLNGTRTFTINNSTAAAADLTVSAIIADGSTALSGLSKDTATGTLVLSGMNTYTGLTNIYGGVLSVSNLGNNGISGNLGNVTAATYIYFDGTLQYTGGAATTDRLLRMGTVAPTIDASGSGAINFTTNLAGGGSTARTLTLTGNNTGNNMLTGVVPNVTAATTLSKTGVGTWVLAGNNTYTGNTTISNGILQFAKTGSLYNGNNTLWTAANVLVASGGTLALNVGGTNEFTTGNVTTLLTNLGGLGGAVNNNGLQAGSKIAFDTTNASGSNFTVGDAIKDSTGTGGGAIGVTKLGTNTLILTGANTYTGATTVNVGTLIINGSTGASAFTVNNSGTLGGSGTIGGSVTVNSGGTLSPGNSPGLLTIGGPLTLAGNVNMEVGTGARGTNYDAVNLGASQLLTYGGTLTLTMTGAVANSTYNLFSFTSGFKTGDFASIAFAGGYFSGTWNRTADLWTSSLTQGQTFTFDQATGDLVAAVPEPATWALLAFSLTVVLVMRRRRC
ncbi:MAG: autotransporter-associated beta strand repeat-containing protein [Verrucomicrobiae bacterium]